MIRKAKVEDAGSIASLIIKVWKTVYKGLIDDNYLNSLSLAKVQKNWERNIISQNNESKIFVYEKNNKILAVIRFGNPLDKGNSSYDAEVHVLYVDVNLRRRGIGSNLFEFAKKDFLKNKKNKLIIWCLKGNEPAINFYKKMGGKIISERQSIVNNIQVQEVGLEIYLTDKIKLVTPTKEHEKQAIEYKQEHFDNGELKISASSKWDKIDDYNEWLKFLEDHSKKETIKDNWTVATEFFGVRERDNKIVGMIQIRQELTTDFLKNYAGHIGYGVRPSERRKGYVTQMLEQALKYCKEKLEFKKVMLSCDRDNEGSRRTIINAGGILEKEYRTEDGENVQIYWIDLK